MAVNVRMNRRAVRALLQGPEVRADLAARGAAIGAAAVNGAQGTGVGAEGDYTVEAPYVGRNRARVTIRTATTEARERENTSHTLFAAITAGSAFNG